MDLNPIHHASPAKNMKCSFMDFVQLLMISQAGRWTQTPSATPLQPKKWNAHFFITINFWFRPDWSMDSNPIHHPSPTNKMKSLFLDYAQLLMIGRAGWWAQTPFATPLQSKNEILIFGLCSLLMISRAVQWTLTPSAIPLQPKKIKCSFLYYVQLLMISQAGQWTRTPSATRLQPKKWNATFWITFNFWWLAGLVNGLKPHPPPLSSQRNEMLLFILCSTSDDQPGWWMDLNPIHHLSPAKKRNVHILIMFNFWWLARLVNGLKPHLPPLCSQKMKSSFFYYAQLLMLARLVNGLKPHPPPLSSQ